jgi:thiamine biosynthesis protein ThiS
MTLHINGEQRDFRDGLTVAALVTQLGMKADRVAVELNLEIVPRAKWETITLKDGDKLEVVHFVGGGSSNPAEVSPDPGLSGMAATSGAWHCPSCGSMVQSRFCSACGEKKFGQADLSWRHFFDHALKEFFHFDSKMFRSFRLLLTRPGFLTSEYLRGSRKPYLHPFQLFFVTNLIYFVLQPLTGWSGLKGWLAVQTSALFYSGFASRMAAHHMAARGYTALQQNLAFDHAVNIQARSLVLLIVPLFAVVVWLLEWRKHRYFGEHLVFALHFTAFALLAVFLGIYGGSTLILRPLAHYGIRLQPGTVKAVLAPFSYLALAFYSFVGLRRVYRDSTLAALLKTFLFVAVFDYVVDIYQFILFLTALYSS